MFVRTVSLLALSCALAAPVLAADVDLSASGAVTADTGSDQPIVVTGQREEYGARETRTATRTDTDVKEVPQALTVISESQIEDQALRSIADVITYVPGAMAGTGEGNRDQITLRGNNTTADFFVDGVRDDVQYSRDLYNVERVEILRGPNAMIFGRGGGGGIVNRVTKRSGLNPYREFSVGADSEGGVRFTGDVDQPLTPSLGLRVNGMYENGESFREGVELERYALNPTLGLAAGPDTRIDISYEYLHDRRTTDRGVPSVLSDGNPDTIEGPLEGYDEIFFGDPDDSYALSKVQLGTFAIEHQLADTLSIRNRTLYGDYDKAYQNIYPSALTDAETVRLSAYRDTTRRKNLISQTDLVWESQIGGIEQTLLLGVELGRQQSRSRRLNGYFQNGSALGATSLLAPLSNPTVDADVIFRPIAADGKTPLNFNETEASIAAAYVQDQIRLTPFLEIVAGLRFDRFTIDATNLNTNAEFSRTDNLWSPRLGVILKPTANLSLYGSYSRSYLPSAGDQFASLDLTSEALKPERFDNYEFGAKWEPIEGLLATAAVYQLERTNTRSIAPDGVTVVLTGAQRSRGIELGLERSVSDRWQVSAGYAFQKAEITSATQAAPEGREVPLVPRHQFSLWNRYDLTPQFGIGLGVVARSKVFTSISNLVELPGYARVDTAIFYELSPGIEGQLNLENILGEDYFSSAHNDNNIAPGAPRTARATLRFRF